MICKLIFYVLFVFDMYLILNELINVYVYEGGENDAIKLGL